MPGTDAQPSPTVLLVDDDMVVLTIARAVLEQASFSVECASDGAQAWDKFQRLSPHLVITDLMMPKMDGFELCAAIRGSSMGQNTPVLVATGLEDVASIEHAYSKGATDFITKPINWDVFRHRVLFVWRAHQTLDKLRSSEEKLAQAGKMQAVGRLAGGVAHDFNNLLTVILGCSQLIQESLPEDAPEVNDLRQIIEAGHRAHGLTRQLLAFSRQQMLVPHPLDLNEVVSNTQKMLLRLLGEDICVHFDPGTPLALVNADSGQIAQILLNLAVNSRDAMPTGGTLQISTANTRLDLASAERFVDTAGFVPGVFAMLSVTDTGVGMTAEVKKQLFDPFFTTKEVGQGTGLGLSMVYGILKQHGGFVAVRSAPGHGTTFELYFPAFVGELEHAQASDGTCDLVGGSERILYVEDDDAVRMVGGRMIRSLGYDVQDVDSAQAALDAVEADGSTIHLLLTDVVMPEMGGIELAREVIARRPDIKVLFVSGYPGGRATYLGENLATESLLPKPFEKIALAEKLRRILDG